MANPGINRHELENICYYAYRTLADEAIASSSTVTPPTGERGDFEDTEAEPVAGGGAEKKKGAMAEEREKDTTRVAEVATGMEPEVETNESSRNAGVV